MTYPRAHLIDAENPGYYHLISRCVRRAWLCGLDDLTGRSFEHRRGWIEQQVTTLSQVFAVELYAYAVMSNHYHLVMRLDPRAPQGWTDETVAQRWVSLTVRDDDIQTALRIESILEDPERLGEYRKRLGSLSWFMRLMNESIARRANREDGCTGRFWEGRFKSHVLLDEQAVTACMAYVDLNPIRAGAAEKIESCDFTSAKRRLAEEPQADRAKDLRPVAGGCDDDPSSLPISTKAYLDLVRWTGAQVTGIPNSGANTTECPAAPIDRDAWLARVQSYRHRDWRAFGNVESLRRYAQSLGQHWLKGVGRVSWPQSSLKQVSSE